jgi:hypothetical protein|uniref:RING-type E3 ubiquitin transferase n=1 Tax=viral metagenome TaxID=1070528 RepID=A0A6C0CXH3_9ZZZZ
MNIFNIDLSNNLNTNINSFVGIPGIDISLNDIEMNEMNRRLENRFEMLMERVLFGNFLLGNQNNSDVLERSFNTDVKYKYVISDEAKELLKKINYNTEECVNDTCPISQEKFENDEEITILPCKHGFKTEYIENWLTKQSSECPVCRFKFESKEIKNEDYKEEENINEGRNNFLNSINSVENIIHPFGRNQIFNTIPHSYINRPPPFRSEEEMLNEAILNSLKDNSGNN